MFKNIVVFTLILVGAFPVLASAAYKLPDTGQKLCYESTSLFNTITCAETGIDGGQDGAYEINSLSFKDNEDGTVTDNNTGLMWQQGYQQDTNWNEAEGVCNSLNQSIFGGHADWRLPTLKELMSIVDYSITYPAPAISSSFSCTNSGRYWAKMDNTKLLAVDFNFGLYFVEEYPDPSPPYHVRCVRGGWDKKQKLVNALEGTVTDTSTGLVWLKSPLSIPTSLRNALMYCQSIPAVEEQAWRLPNMRELESWLDSSGNLNTDFFPGTPMGQYWSSTTTYGFVDEALIVDVSSGTLTTNAKDGFLDPNEHYVQCVRSIPKVLDGDLNGDGQVTIIDVLLALRAAVELDATTQFYLDHADIAPINSGEGAITPADALLILQRAVGLDSW